MKRFSYTNTDILSKYSKIKTPEPIFVQDEINNLNKYMKFIQSLIKMMLFGTITTEILEEILLHILPCS